MSILFTKMQGAGNDFVIIDNRDYHLSKKRIIELAPELCDRKFGVGADGIMALLPAENSEIDYSMFYRNADGSDAGMCGNGARCLALYAWEKGLGTTFSFNVHDTVYQAEVIPEKRHAIIHFPIQATIKEIAIEGEVPLFQLHTGTEHLVWEVTKTRLEDTEWLVEQGRRLRYHPYFDPPGTNVNFITGLSKNRINLQTYERGVEDLTLACGTGAIASALTWHYLQQSSTTRENNIQITVEGGLLGVRFDYQSTDKTYHNIQLSGPAHFVFEGKYGVGMV